MKVNDFDYFLPHELIAQHPCLRRDRSRLLVLQKKSGSINHRHFYELGEILRPDDLLVLNDTKVLPARLYGQKASGGRVEVLLLRPVTDGIWVCLLRPAKRVPVGTRMIFGHGLSGQVLARETEGMARVAFSSVGNEFREKLAQVDRKSVV